ncbi:MAG: histidine kinase dimerization/phosphoacceptor domain -containing protein [Desulforhopalus sp.]
MHTERALVEENQRLRKQLQEAEELIDAIRNGRVDALVVSDSGEKSIYTLQGADNTYRILVETMNEGAVIFSREAVMLYCNRSFAHILQMPLHQLTGSTITEFFADQEQFQSLRHRVFAGENIRMEINLLSGHQVHVPSLISLRAFSMGGLDTVCMVVTDLTEQKKTYASLTEKEVLLKEIHHRVKNNLQVISSLVSLQADEVQEPGMHATFQDLIYRVHSMAMVHEKLYQSSDMAHIDFADYVESLVGYLWRAQGKAVLNIRLELDLKPVLLPVNTAVPCGLILNELISNALKHAFNGRESGTVKVSLGETSGKNLRLSVGDNGIGLAKTVDWEQSKSLGLRIIKLLAMQINAHVEVSNDNGTRFTIEFDR